MAGEPQLDYGISSEWVQYLQQLLAAAGYSVEVNGSFDEVTLDAVRQFQQANGLNPTGSVGQETWDVLVPAAGGASSSESSSGSSPEAAESQIQSVKFWLKAFIPGDVPGWTKDGVGPSSHTTVLTGPISWINDCFWTDNRSFDSDIGASARMHSEVEIDLSATSPTMAELHYCGETHECDCEDGEIEGAATADTSRMHFSNLRGTLASGVKVDLAGAANNPLFTGSPDIDYTGTLTITQNTVSFAGLVNGFPAYEAYCEINGSGPYTLFTFGPAGDPTDLIGDASLPVHGSAVV
jgi:Putative peptidoglycan binding domain/Protein of unknown function (DUF3238)